MTPPDSFREAFLLAKRICSDWTSRYAFVYAKNDSLLSTDAYRLAEINCPNIPAELQGKGIVRIDDQGVAITEEVFPPRYPECLISEHFIDNPNIAEMTTVEEEASRRLGTDEVVMLHVPGADIMLNNRYIKEAQDVLGTVSRLGYINDRQPVIFYSDLGRISILPMRKSGD
jgi:hypothetical protein